MIRCTDETGLDHHVEIGNLEPNHEANCHIEPAMSLEMTSRKVERTLLVTKAMSE